MTAVTGSTFILAFISVIFITQTLGPELYGSLATIIAFSILFTPIADLGLNNAHIKKVSEGQDLDDCFSTYIMGKLSLTVIMVSILLASWFLLIYIEPTMNTAQNWAIFLAILGQTTLIQVSSIVTLTYMGKTEFARSQLISLIDPCVRVPLIIAFCLSGYGIVEIAIAYFTGTFIMTMVGLISLRRSGIRWKKPTLFSSYIKFALPFTIPIVVGAVCANIDKLTISATWGPLNVGYYSSAQTLVNFFGIVGAASFNTTFPTFSKMQAENKKDQIKDIMAVVNRFIILLLAPAIILLVVYPHAITTILFGLDFWEAGEDLRFLSLAMLISCISQIYNVKILVINRQSVFAKIAIVGLLIEVILLIVLVPGELGPFTLAGLSDTGAAIALLVMNISSFILLRRYAGISFDGKSRRFVIRLLLVSGITALSLWILGFIIPMNTALVMILYAIASMAIFYGGLIAIKEITRSDVQYVLDVINPRKMNEYISSEMRPKK